MKKTSIILLIALLCSPFYLNLQVVHADEPATLADAINNVLSNIQTTDSPWEVIYGQVFGLQNQTVFDDAILQALNQSDYQDVIFIARLAELNNYSSSVINDSVRAALQNMPMCGSLPITYYNNGDSDCASSFLVYDRYMVNAYRYAQEPGISGWNLTQAFIDFANAYLKPPTNSQSGEMLWINPQENFFESYSRRYYDEYAETLEMFLEFALAGVNTTISYNGQTLSPINFADDMWLNTQSLWNGEYYNYNPAPIVECEMGNFAQIIAEYQNFSGNLTYFDRVIQDLEYKLLAENFSSPAWGTVGVLKHADGNPQLRLGETTGALIALQMLYPYFSPEMQANFRDMLGNGVAWQGLLNSDLHSNGHFRFTNDDGVSYSDDDATSLGSMLLFLYGVIPNTGYLAINASEERYGDYRTCFPTSEWNFNYKNQTIRIPLMAGTLSFIFGSQEVTQSFPTNGVYNIQFSSDWNNITSVTKVVDINSVVLQSVTLQSIQPLPPSLPLPNIPFYTYTPSTNYQNTNTKNQTQTNQNSTTSTSSENNNSIVPILSSPTPTQQDTPTQKPSDTSMQAYVIVFIMSAAFGSATALYYVKRKNRQVGTLGNKNLRTFICRNKKRL